MPLDEYHPESLGSRMTWFERFSQKVTHLSGRPGAFLAALGIIVVWALSGPLFGFADTWQLVINTGTTIITFLMVFLIQQTQNKDSKAMELKLNELVAATSGASNRLVDVEALSEDELDVLRDYFRQLVDLSKRDYDLTESHSLEEAEKLHGNKPGPKSMSVGRGEDESGQSV